MDEFLDLARYVLEEFMVYFEAYWQILALFVLIHLLLALVLSRRKREKNEQEREAPDVAAPRQKQRKRPKSVLAPVAPNTESDSSAVLLSVFKNDLYLIDEVIYQGRFGVDFVASREGRRTLVNGKWWKKKVNDNAVFSISEARTYYRCDFILLVSEQGFTRAARKAAADHNVTLWDRRQLQRENIRSRSGVLNQAEVAAGEDNFNDN